MDRRKSESMRPGDNGKYDDGRMVKMMRMMTRMMDMMTRMMNLMMTVMITSIMIIMIIFVNILFVTSNLFTKAAKLKSINETDSKPNSEMRDYVQA